jgi:hypothetical protein
MKKIFLSVSMVALLAAGALAQGLSGGLKGGLNLANFSGDDVSGTDMKVAYHVGGYVNFAFTESLSLQPELLYNAVGPKISEDGTDVKYNVSYVSLPVMLMYSFGVVNIQAGPQVGFLSKAEINDSSVKDFVKSSDLSLGLGAGWDFPFGLSLDLRYNLGLSDNNDGFNTDQLKNQVWQVSAGFKLLKFGK